MALPAHHVGEARMLFLRPLLMARETLPIRLMMQTVTHLARHALKRHRRRFVAARALQARRHMVLVREETHINGDGISRSSVGPAVTRRAGDGLTRVVRATVVTGLTAAGVPLAGTHVR